MQGTKIKAVLVCAGIALGTIFLSSPAMAADGVDLGFEVVFLIDLTRPVGSPPDSISLALATLKTKGVIFTTSSVLMH